MEWHRTNHSRQHHLPRRDNRNTSNVTGQTSRSRSSSHHEPRHHSQRRRQPRTSHLQEYRRKSGDLHHRPYHQSSSRHHSNQTRHTHNNQDRYQHREHPYANPPPKSHPPPGAQSQVPHQNFTTGDHFSKIAKPTTTGHNESDSQEEAEVFTYYFPPHKERKIDALTMKTKASDPRSLVTIYYPKHQIHFAYGACPVKLNYERNDLIHNGHPEHTADAHKIQNPFDWHCHLKVPQPDVDQFLDRLLQRHAPGNEDAKAYADHHVQHIKHGRTCLRKLQIQNRPLAAPGPNSHSAVQPASVVKKTVPGAGEPSVSNTSTSTAVVANNDVATPTQTISVGKSGAPSTANTTGAHTALIKCTSTTVVASDDVATPNPSTSVGECEVPVTANTTADTDSADGPIRVAFPDTSLIELGGSSDESGLPLLADISKKWGELPAISNEHCTLIDEASERIRTDNGHGIIEKMLQRFHPRNLAKWTGRKGYLPHYLVDVQNLKGLGAFMCCV